MVARFLVKLLVCSGGLERGRVRRISRAQSARRR